MDALALLDQRLDCFLQSGLTPDLIHKKMEEVLGIFQAKASSSNVQWLPEGVSEWFFTFNDNHMAFSVTLYSDCRYAISGYNGGNVNGPVTSAKDFSYFKRYLVQRSKHLNFVLPKLGGE